jgi:hypothetical protein
MLLSGIYTLMRAFFQILYSISLIFLKGFVLFQLWKWFIYPYFNQVPELTFFISVGIVTMASVLLYLPIWKFDNYEDEFKYNITIGFKPLVLLALGWIIHLFI